jgi:hypothetical protein
MGGYTYKIERFAEGDNKRTAFSAETMNEIIDALNCLLASEGRGGIRIVKSDANFVWEYTGATGSFGTGSTQYTSSITQSYNYSCICRYA